MNKLATWRKRIASVWPARRRDILLGGAVVLSALLVLGGGLLIWQQSTTRATTTLSLDGPQSDELVRHPLTGETFATPLVSLPQVFAVMVENSADAWPLSGLDEAFLVIEAPVEGAIPRFVAFFYDGQEVEKIGPVRSARPYYLDWAAELDSLYAHVGGSPEALSLIGAGVAGLHDLNQFFQDEYFWRANGGRYAPHNVYTSTEDLRAAVEDLELASPAYDLWKFADGTPSGETKSLHIDWVSGSTYDIDWLYSAESNVYARVQGAARTFLEGGATVSAANVIVMETDITVIDSVGRRDLRTTGSGKALLAQNGSLTSITWKKDDTRERLRFFALTGEEIAMNAGATWVEVVPSLDQVEEVMPEVQSPQ